MRRIRIVRPGYAVRDRIRRYSFKEDRHPAFAVASYSMLLLAAARAYGLDATEGTLPPPKWRNQANKQRVSTQKLIQQLRSEVWSCALKQLKANSNGFVTQTEVNTKCLELQLPLYSTVLYASTG